MMPSFAQASLQQLQPQQPGRAAAAHRWSSLDKAWSWADRALSLRRPLVDVRRKTLDFDQTNVFTHDDGHAQLFVARQYQDEHPYIERPFGDLQDLLDCTARGRFSPNSL